MLSLVLSAVQKSWAVQGGSKRAVNHILQKHHIYLFICLFGILRNKKLPDFGNDTLPFLVWTSNYDIQISCCAVPYFPAVGFNNWVSCRSGFYNNA